jgi:hypothetical protein
MANPVVYRRNLNIGAADASDDDAFLATCFFDNGDIEALLDCSNPRCIVVGRTGAGKTALLKELLRRTNRTSVKLSPETLALSYLSNSKAIEFFEEAGAHMELYYKMMWQHILVIEMLKIRYGVCDQSSQNEMFSKLWGRLRNDRAKTEAMRYVQEFGGTFWCETSERTKNITNRLETDLKACGKVHSGMFEGGAEAARHLSQEEKKEIIQHGQEVVARLQLDRLSGVLDLLKEDIFADESQNYFIVIDGLDENWVEEKLRFKLIRALVEATKSLRQIQNVKVIFSLREDLLDAVLRKTAGPGFQREKYTSLYLRIRWTRSQLIQMLDKRVNLLFKKQYTKDNVSLNDILPTNQIAQRTMLDYLVDRTFLRPRDAILFVNECIVQADGSAKITKDMLLQAEGIYSQSRMESLYDEWGRQYPAIASYCSLLRNIKTPIEVSDLDDQFVEPLCVKLIEDERLASDLLVEKAEKYYLEKSLPVNEFVGEWLSALYQVGVVGVKLQPYLPIMWAFEHEPVLQASNITLLTKIVVHKTFWRALGISTRSYSDMTALVETG